MIFIPRINIEEQVIDQVQINERINITEKLFNLCM